MSDIYTFTVNGRTVSTQEDKPLLRFLRDDLISLFKVSFLHLGDEFRNVDVYRASADTWLVLAVKTAVCFIHGNFCRVS